MDVEALALERYPDEAQGPERRAFMRGFMEADPGQAVRDPFGLRTVPWGERSALFRSLDVGDSAVVPLQDAGVWNIWRSTAAHLKRTYGCRFTVVWQGNELKITRKA